MSPRRIDTVIGGVQKGGTTRLATALKWHPRIALARGKEAHWFDSEERFAAGAPDSADYHAFFGHAAPGARLVDATPNYLFWPPAAQRIHDYNPAMLWIVLLRDPASRAYSQWNMQRETGLEKLPFEAALDEEMHLLRTAPGHYHPQLSYLARGFYAQQLERVFALFGRERVLVLRSDDYRAAPDRTVATVLEFLGLDAPAEPLPEGRPHEGRYAAPLDPSTRAKLVALYAPEIGRLEALLGWDLSAWRG